MAVAGAVLSTVTQTPAEVWTLPAPSKAFTVRVWVPSPTPTVFQLSA